MRQPRNRAGSDFFAGFKDFKILRAILPDSQIGLAMLLIIAPAENGQRRMASFSCLGRYAAASPLTNSSSGIAACGLSLSPW